MNTCRGCRVVRVSAPLGISRQTWRCGHRAIRGTCDAERHGQPPRHTSDEIENIGKSDLTALLDFLGDNPYLLGSEPTSYDATAYSYVAHAIQQDYDSRMKKFIKTLPNLTGYWERLTARLYKA
jgi:glutathione S-transferase